MQNANDADKMALLIRSLLQRSEEGLIPWALTDDPWTVLFDGQSAGVLVERQHSADGTGRSQYTIRVLDDLGVDVDRHSGADAPLARLYQVASRQARERENHSPAIDALLKELELAAAH